MAKLVFLNKDNVVVSFIEISNEEQDLEPFINSVGNGSVSHLIVPEETLNVGMGSEYFNGFFRHSKPYESWVWDEEGFWSSPIPHPGQINSEDKDLYEWDEESLSWIKVDKQ